MLFYSTTSVTGWTLVVLLVVTVLYPFLLRAGVLGPVQPFLVRMRFHYWLGYTITAIVLVHTWISMSTRLAGSVNETGLYLATGALILVCIQVGIGRRLSWPKLSQRHLLRRWHLGLMIGIAVLVLSHILLDSAMLHMLLFR